MRFHVALELDSAIRVREREIGDEAPRFIFGRVERLAGVVLLHPGAEVVGQADIVLIRVGNTFEQVDVFQAAPPQNILRQPDFARFASYAGQASLPLRDTQALQLQCRAWLARRSFRVAEAKPGGAKRDRTADLLHAMQALSQLSYGPVPFGFLSEAGNLMRTAEEGVANPFSDIRFPAAGRTNASSVRPSLYRRR
jgi:hypothetical protein